MFRSEFEIGWKDVVEIGDLGKLLIIEMSGKVKESRRERSFNNFWVLEG